MYKLLVIIILIVIIIILKKSIKHRDFFYPNSNNELSKYDNLIVDNKINVPTITVDSINANSMDVNNLSLLPKNSIIIWGDTVNNIPDGWAVCNGRNGTPDLQGRFVLGYNDGNANLNINTESNTQNTDVETQKIINRTITDDDIVLRNLNETGGEENHVLSIDEIPSHKHDFKYDGENGTSPGIPKNDDINGVNRGTKNRFRINNNGDNKPHNNMPPFYVLVYIMKL